MMETLFWCAIGFIAYAYAGYPVALMLISFVRKRPVKKKSITPSVSIVIAAYNEEKAIRQKLENTLSLKYPRENLEIVVASDCSSDQTDAIVKSFENRGVRLVRAPARNGKEAVQKLAVAAVSGARVTPAKRIGV